ncbi:MAG TPA: aldo/keto reductase [Steroidobacteraceae bacterium]|nr:aldo/keto reductase [Steroidobacteraceae bacterium]
MQYSKVMAANITLRPFGSTRAQVACIGQGTWKLEAASAGVAALRRGLDLGLTHIDSAEMYGSGAAEQLVGKAIQGRRDEVFLVSKVLPGNATKSGTVAACEKSLAHLRTDRLDCYLLHWRGSVPLEETLGAFELLVRRGKILSWGVSNFDAQDLAEVAAIAGPGHPACNQVLYHLKERAIEHAVLPWCRKHGCAVVAYTPFGRSPAIFDGNSKPAQVLEDIGAAHGATPRQVALRFLLRHREVFVIPKASDLKHVAENAGASAVDLSDDDIAKIEAVFPRGKAPRGLPMI